jgi:DNA-binding beta-propeller fold protein YncE
VIRDRLARAGRSLSLAMALGLAAAGCGTSHPAVSGGAMPPAAEPAVSPPPVMAPAGEVVPAGPEAEGLAVDPATGTVAVGDSSGALLFDESGRLLHKVNLPAGPRHIGLFAPGGPFLVPAQGANELAFVDPRSGTVERIVPTGTWPHDVAVAGSTVFAGNELGNTVTVVRGGRVVATISVVTQPGGLAVTGNTLAVVGVRARRLELLDTRTLREIASAPAETGPSHVEAYGRSVYVVDTGGGALDVFALDPHLHQLARLALPGSPLGIAVDGAHHRLWVTLTASNTLVEFDLSGPLPRRLSTFPTVQQPNSVAVDPTSGTVFVAGAASGVLEILSPSVTGG